MPNTHYFTADLSHFKSPTPSILFGEHLKEVNALRQSITLYGLLSPLTVIRKGGHLVVVDGHKRLAALRRMNFVGDLPLYLKSLPYLVVSRANHVSHRLVDNPLPLLKNPEKHALITRLAAQDIAPDVIAKALYTSTAVIEQVLSIEKLSEKLKSEFFSGALSLSQACAISTLKHAKAQDKLLDMLGTYIDAPSIIKAIELGATVVDCGNDNLLFLPSRPTLAIGVASAA